MNKTTVSGHGLTAPIRGLRQKGRWRWPPSMISKCIPHTARHAALRAALREAMATVDQGVNLLKTIKRLSGWEIPKFIDYRARAGVEKINEEDEDENDSFNGEDQAVEGYRLSRERRARG